MLYALISSPFFSTITDCCDKLFELFNSFAETNKRKAAVWPLQMMLLVLCPVSHVLQMIWLEIRSQKGLKI